MLLPSSGLKCKRNVNPEGSMQQEEQCSSEMSVASQRTIWRYIPKDTALHKHRCETLKPHSSAYLQAFLQYSYPV
jgi:hypothetical protein